MARALFTSGHTRVSLRIANLYIRRIPSNLDRDDAQDRETIDLYWRNKLSLLESRARDSGFGE